MTITQHQIEHVFALARSDPAQSFGINNWCYARAMRMAGLMLREAVDPHAIGWVTIWTPPRWLHKDGRWPVMTGPAADRFSLRELLGGRSEAVVSGYLFRHTQTRDGDYVVILRENGDGFDGAAFTGEREISYSFTDMNCGTWWDNHIAPTIEASGASAPRKIVIDPDVADRPVTLSEWRELQDPSGDTCLLLANWDGEARIDRENSSLPNLQCLVQSLGDRNECAHNEEDIIWLLTNGAIPDGRFHNPFHPPAISDEAGVPSITASFSHFAEWLAPLAAFRHWRAKKVEELITAGTPRNRGAVKRADSVGLDLVT